MFYLSLIKTSILVCLAAIPAGIILFLLILFIMRAFNKYNTRNGCFISLSFIMLPVLIIQLALVFSLLNIQSTIVTEAHNYARGLAFHVDNYQTELSGAACALTNNAVDSIPLPNNPVGLMLEKYPLLSHFLDEHELSGNNATEIVDAAFVKINRFILNIILKCLMWLGIFVAAFCSISVLWGWAKAHRKKKRVAT